LQRRAVDIAEVDQAYILSRLKELSLFNLGDYLKANEAGSLVFAIDNCTDDELVGWRN